MTEAVSHVRCVVFAHRDDRELTEVLGFLRGFSALYGSGLALDSDVRSSAAEVDELATQELSKHQPVQVNEHQEATGELFTRISLELQHGSKGNQELIVFGKTALMQWMKQQLLESRGDRAQVGKSTVCLGLVGALLRSGYSAGEIAYIKPATQCEKPQLVAKFCRQQGITVCDVGPILFYKGFTREFLKGETDTSAELLAKAKEKVDEVGRGKKVVIVDGVGYPAVGSICGVSNAHVAKAVQAPVVLVGKKGVGDAVDSFNLNATFFESHGVKVLGGIFNRLPSDGFYSLEHCRESVTAYFDKFQPEKCVYGFLPELSDGGHTALIVEKANDEGENALEPGVFLTAAEDELATKIVDVFVQSINLTNLLADAGANQSSSTKEPKKEPTTTNGAAKSEVASGKPKAKAKVKKVRNFVIPTTFETMAI
ncbi:hypothetical protein BBO99_00001961 [Phytophthora kernoviae]|uniref:Uncharacterized protein n=2 Tax=Phytophthora kernoviae TaxID=325452 RepID=A0A3R7J465_9STRA|nr:hypothetical protein G195_002510 [Phytophthora kernoviae 00238/432]KAG2530188.1 hypothetical protein JM16_001642 [Phytophthora kernoviae]KAG2530303.1 hypothetical protein JM18_001812 [Phytophthora kernoviae]RLN20236.1 hypothetical protein BBI17_001989 [Phytophthora kernoviae]RLN83572.1 hypothetical protein BBO99_00001961 [Phytophthora kernoviae]